MIFAFILIFILGLAIGSFINALEYRIESKMSINGRSLCPHCKHKLAWYDLAPVLSYVFLRGKCRYCGKGISAQYPIVELLAGISFLAIFLEFGFPTDIRAIFVTFLLLFIISVAILVGLHDYKTTYILSGWVYAGVAAAILLIGIRYSGAIAWQPIVGYIEPFLLSALIPGLFFFSMYFFSKGKWMGEGEYELAVFIGLTLGSPLAIPAYYFAFVVGSVVGLALVYISKKKQMNSEIPFGPFLMAGLIFALIFGQQIVNLYARIFLS